MLTGSCADVFDSVFAVVAISNHEDQPLLVCERHHILALASVDDNVLMVWKNPFVSAAVTSSIMLFAGKLGAFSNVATTAAVAEYRPVADNVFKSVPLVNVVGVLDTVFSAIAYVNHADHVSLVPL